MGIYVFYEKVNEYYLYAVCLGSGDMYIEGMGWEGDDCQRTNINYLELHLHNLV